MSRPFDQEDQDQGPGKRRLEGVLKKERARRFPCGSQSESGLELPKRRPSSLLDITDALWRRMHKREAYRRPSPPSTDVSRLETRRGRLWSKKSCPLMQLPQELMDQIACQLRALPFMAFRQTCRRLYHHLDVRLWTAQDAFARFESEHVPLRHLFRQVSAEKFAGLLKGCSACQTRHPMIWFSPFELLKISLVRRCRAVYLSPNGSMTETECRNALDAVSPDLKPWQRSHRVETFAAVPRPVSLGMPSDHLAVADIADTAIVALYLWNGKRRVSIGMHIMIPVVIGTDDRSAPLTESRLRIKSTADAAIRICSHMTVGRYLALAGDFGLFEQVRTETIWCLCQRNQPMYMHGRLLPDHQALLLTIETAYFEGGQDSVATPHAKIIKKDPGIWSPTTTTDEFKLITKHSAGSTDVTG